MENVLTSLINPLINILPRLPEAILTFIVGWIFLQIAIYFLDKSLSFRILKLPKGLKGVILSLAKFFFWVALIIFLINSLGFGKLALAISGSTAIVMFILSSGASGLVADIISGLFLASDPDFNVGDTVKSGEDKTQGTVLSMDLRKCRMEDDKGKIHIIPNSVIEKKEWVVVARGAQKK